MCLIHPPETIKLTTTFDGVEKFMWHKSKTCPVLLLIAGESGLLWRTSGDELTETGANETLKHMLSHASFLPAMSTMLAFAGTVPALDPNTLQFKQETQVSITDWVSSRFTIINDKGLSRMASPEPFIIKEEIWQFA